MRTDDAINFLLYSYFEITLDADEDKIINAAIKRAYRDASSHVLSLNEDGKKKVKKEFEKGGKDKIIYNDIKQLFDNQHEGEDYNSFHNGLCRKLKEEYVEYGCNYSSGAERIFTYGIAQKWVNMTMKYLCVIDAIFEENKCNGLKNYRDALKKLEGNLHVPIDSYILESASKKGEELTYRLGIDVPKKDGKPLPWSKWDFDGDNQQQWNNYKNYYYTFQQGIADRIKGVGIDREGQKENGKIQTPLEWENLAWIEVAENRKKQ